MPAEVTPKKLDSFLGGANLADFGDDDPTHTVAAQTQGKPAAPVSPARKPANHTTPAAPVKPAEATDFGEDDDPDADDKHPVVPAKPVQVAKPEPDEPKLVKHLPQVLALAAQYGIGEDEAGLYSHDELRRELLRLKRESGNVSKPAAPAKSEPEPEATIDWGEHDSPDGEGKRKWTDADISDAIVHAMKGQQKQIDALTGQIRHLMGNVQRQAAVPLMNRVKAEVARYGDFFGNAEPVQGSPEHQRCLMVMQALDNFGHQGRKPNPAVDVPEVMKTLFGLDAPEGGNVSVTVPKEKPVDAEVEAIKNGFATGAVHKPTQKNSPELPKGEARARKAVASELRKKGFEPAAEAEDDDTSFG